MGSSATSQMKIFKKMTKTFAAALTWVHSLTCSPTNRLLCNERTPILKSNNIGGQASANGAMTRDNSTISYLPKMVIKVELPSFNAKRKPYRNNQILEVRQMLKGWESIIY